MGIKMSSMMLLFVLGISIAISSYGKSTTMAEASPAPAPSPAASVAVYIVLTEEPPANVVAEAFHLQTLSTVLGSEEAAKKALVYVYKNAVTGFAALLTPDQVAKLKGQPGVLEIIPDQKLELFNPRIGTMNIRN